MMWIDSIGLKIFGLLWKRNLKPTCHCSRSQDLPASEFLRPGKAAAQNSWFRSQFGTWSALFAVGKWGVFIQYESMSVPAKKAAILRNRANVQPKTTICGKADRMRSDLAGNKQTTLRAASFVPFLHLPEWLDGSENDTKFKRSECDLKYVKIWEVSRSKKMCCLYIFCDSQESTALHFDAQLHLDASRPPNGIWTRLVIRNQSI